MIIFRVAEERHGWCVQMDQHMKTPFRTRDLAIREAHDLAASLHAHGQCAEVIIDGASIAYDGAIRRKLDLAQFVASAT